MDDPPPLESFDPDPPAIIPHPIVRRGDPHPLESFEPDPHAHETIIPHPNETTKTPAEEKHDAVVTLDHPLLPEVSVVAAVVGVSVVATVVEVSVAATVASVATHCDIPLLPQTEWPADMSTQRRLLEPWMVFECDHPLPT